MTSLRQATGFRFHQLIGQADGAGRVGNVKRVGWVYS